MPTTKDYRKLLNYINAMILKYGKDISANSVFRLTCINPDGSNYYGTTIEKEIEICERIKHETNTII